jgi:hypothetical protein
MLSADILTVAPTERKPVVSLPTAAGGQAN